MSEGQTVLKVDQVCGATQQKNCQGMDISVGAICTTSSGSGSHVVQHPDRQRELLVLVCHLLLNCTTPSPHGCRIPLLHQCSVLGRRKIGRQQNLAHLRA